MGSPKSSESLNCNNVLLRFCPIDSDFLSWSHALNTHKTRAKYDEEIVPYGMGSENNSSDSLEVFLRYDKKSFVFLGSARINVYLCGRSYRI
jgi:hypothetical protein